jgi:hypothetical protein
MEEIKMREGLFHLKNCNLKKAKKSEEENKKISNNNSSINDK